MGISSHLIIFVLNIFVVAATIANKKSHPGGQPKPSNESVSHKRERNKINSLARALQLEHALYQDETVMRFAAISDQINNVDKHVEKLVS
jgi:hypothetical protein